MRDPGPLTYSHPAVVNVATSSTEIVAADSDRRYLLIINNSISRVDIKVGAAAVLGQGIPLNKADAGGNIQGAYEMSQGTGNLSQQAVYGIHAGASGLREVLVIEVTGPSVVRPLILRSPPAKCRNGPPYTRKLSNSTVGPAAIWTSQNSRLASPTKLGSAFRLMSLPPGSNPPPRIGRSRVWRPPYSNGPASRGPWCSEIGPGLFRPC